MTGRGQAIFRQGNASQSADFVPAEQNLRRIYELETFGQTSAPDHADRRHDRRRNFDLALEACGCDNEPREMRLGLARLRVGRRDGRAWRPRSVGHWSIRAALHNTNVLMLYMLACCGWRRITAAAAAVLRIGAGRGGVRFRLRRAVLHVRRRRTAVSDHLRGHAAHGAGDQRADASRAACRPRKRGRRGSASRPSSFATHCFRGFA